jgi:hypothetical protein
MEIGTDVIAGVAAVAALGSWWLARRAVSQADETLEKSKEALDQTHEMLIKTIESVKLARETVVLGETTRRESVLAGTLERLMLVGQKVSDLLWEANASPWNVGQPLHDLRRLLAVEPTEMTDAKMKVDAMRVDLLPVFMNKDSTDQEKVSAANEIKVWAEQAEAQIEVEIGKVSVQLAESVKSRK